MADFAIGALPELTAGKNRVTLDNRGRQTHEIDLVELGDGKTIQDAIPWAPTFAGPRRSASWAVPPSGRAAPRSAGTFELRPGVRYAFVCIVPDSLATTCPTSFKGMTSPVFEVSPCRRRLRPPTGRGTSSAPVALFAAVSRPGLFASVVVGRAGRQGRRRRRDGGGKTQNQGLTRAFDGRDGRLRRPC